MNQKQLQQMMAQAQKLQQEMGKMQDELGKLTVEGKAGSYVTVTMNGLLEVKGIVIAPEVVDPEDVETLQDLIMTAINDASQKAQAMAEQRRSALTGGMKIPGMF